MWSIISASISLDYITSSVRDCSTASACGGKPSASMSPMNPLAVAYGGQRRHNPAAVPLKLGPCEQLIDESCYFSHSMRRLHCPPVRNFFSGGALFFAVSYGSRVKRGFA